MLLTSATVSLFAAAGVCLAVMAIDIFQGRQIKILALGPAMLFAAIGIYYTFIDPALSRSAVKLAVDSGIFAISFGSIVFRRPFTLQYAIESVPPETVAMPGFLRANYIITGAWTMAALLMMLANAATLYVPGLPIWISLAVAFAARNSAVYFTKWYPAYRKAKYLPQAGTLSYATN
jgi:hypothetical protein